MKYLVYTDQHTGFIHLTAKMANTLELYYFPASFYSQKAYLTLLEKDLSFKENIVYIHFGDQYKEWYLRLNPNGLVPVIKNGSDVVYESEVIIDYLDKQFKSGSKLVPDVSTPLGQRVSETRKWIDAVPVEIVTFGVLLHPEFRPEKHNIPKTFLKQLNAEKTKKEYESKLMALKERQKKDPSLHDALGKKIAQFEWKLENTLNKDTIKQTLQNLNQTFDRMESELEKMQKENGTDAVWICGTTFTAPDILAAILFNRLKMLGLDQEHYTATKRPRVLAYRNRLYARPSMQKLVVDLSMERVLKLMKWKVASQVAKKAAKVVLGVGVIAAIAFGVKTYLDRK